MRVKLGDVTGPKHTLHPASYRLRMLQGHKLRVWQAHAGSIAGPTNEPITPSIPRMQLLVVDINLRKPMLQGTANNVISK